MQLLQFELRCYKYVTFLWLTTTRTYRQLGEGRGGGGDETMDTNIQFKLLLYLPRSLDLLGDLFQSMVVLVHAI